MATECDKLHFYQALVKRLVGKMTELKDCRAFLATFGTSALFAPTDALELVGVGGQKEWREFPISVPLVQAVHEHLGASAAQSSPDFMGAFSVALENVVKYGRGGFAELAELGVKPERTLRTLLLERFNVAPSIVAQQDETPSTPVPNETCWLETLLDMGVQLEEGVQNSVCVVVCVEYLYT